jgi:hypothetical protein
MLVPRNDELCACECTQALCLSKPLKFIRVCMQSCVSHTSVAQSERETLSRECVRCASLASVLVELELLGDGKNCCTAAGRNWISMCHSTVGAACHENVFLCLSSPRALLWASPILPTPQIFQSTETRLLYLFAQLSQSNSTFVNTATACVGTHN